MRKMKQIDVITKYFFPQDGGIERSILETYSRLANSGFVVTVHTSTNTYEKGGVLPEKSKMKRLKVRRYPKHSFDLLPKASYFGTDFLILHNFNILPHGIILFISLCLKLVHLKKFKLIISPHGGMTPNYKNFGKYESIIKKWINIILIRVFVNNTADSVRLVSKWEENAVKKLGINPGLIKYIPDGIDNEAFAKIKKEKIKDSGVVLPAKYIIQIGKIYPTKKYETVIKALKLLNDKRIKLLIIGRVKDKHYFDSLCQIAKSENVYDRVFFVSYVPVDLKYRLLANAEAFVLSSDWESFGRVCYEALSQGTIVLVSDKTAPSLLTGNEIFGFRFNNKNPKELSELIIKALKIRNSGDMRTVRAKNKKFATNFSWKNVSGEFQKLLESLNLL